MPYRDPEQRRTYHRDYARARRAGEIIPRVKPAIPSAARAATAADVVRILAGQVEAVRRARRLGVVERARAVGYVASVLLRAIETADLAKRLEELEARLEGVTHAGVN